VGLHPEDEADEAKGEGEVGAVENAAELHWNLQMFITLSEACIGEPKRCESD
jgi:hypothetical protein